MKYKLNKPKLEQLQAGDILLMAPYKNKYKYPISLMIGWWLQDRWTHSSIFICEDIIIEATHKGIHYDSLSQGKYLNDYDWVALRLKPKYQNIIPDMIKFAKSKLWDGYDYVQAVWVAVMYAVSLIFKISKKKLLKMPNKFDSRDRYFCHDLCVKSLKAAGIDVSKLLGIDDGNVMADDLLTLADIFDVIVREN